MKKAEIEFSFTHDLDRLRNLLPENWYVRRQYPDLSELTEWAVQSRYPGDLPEAVERDAQNAVRQAHGLLEAMLENVDLDQQV